MPQRHLIHIHAAAGTQHLSAGRRVTGKLRVNAQHMEVVRVIMEQRIANYADFQESGLV